MSNMELLSIEPLELNFVFELKKQISSSLQLSNKTDSYVAFKVKTTNPKKYCVRPNTGIVLPRSTCDVIVTMQAQKETPSDMQCKDKFLLQSVKTHDGATPKDITAEMFNKELGHVVEECKLRVVYLSPPQPPSPVAEGSEEGSSPRGSVSENGNVSGADSATVTRAFTERHEAPEKSAEAKALLSRLTEEKNSAIQQNNKLRQELVALGQNMAGASCIFCEIATKSSSTPLLHSDDKVVVFQDINPSAFRHYLVIPVEHIPTVKDLQTKTEHYSLVSHMLEVGRTLLLRDAPQAKHYRFGFHQPPLNSVNHLHLHCLALPYTPRWRCIKYLSFGPLGFIEAEKFLEKIKPLSTVHSKV